MATISKRGNRWLVQVRRKGIPAVSRTFDTMADAKAKAWATLEEAQIEKAQPPSPRGLLTPTRYAEIIRKYREQITPDKRSADTETQRLRCFETGALAATPLIELTPVRLAAYRDERLRKVKPATVRRELALISHSLESAKKSGDSLYRSTQSEKSRSPWSGTRGISGCKPVSGKRSYRPHWRAVTVLRHPAIRSRALVSSNAETLNSSLVCGVGRAAQIPSRQR